MSDLLSVGASGLRAYGRALSNVGDNIANAQTPGYARRTTRLEELAGKVDGKAKVMKHDVDAHPATPSQFRIMSIPTIIIFKDGQPVEKFVGVQDTAVLEAAIAKHI